MRGGLSKNHFKENNPCPTPGGIWSVDNIRQVGQLETMSWDGCGPNTMFEKEENIIEIMYFTYYNELYL